MVNSPTVGGEQMGDAGHDGNFCNIAPACLPDFIHTLRAMLQCKPVLLADVALANGADTELMKALAQEDLLAKLTSYSGWNLSLIHIFPHLKFLQCVSFRCPLSTK